MVKRYKMYRRRKAYEWHLDKMERLEAFRHMSQVHLELKNHATKLNRLSGVKK